MTDFAAYNRRLGVAQPDPKTFTDLLRQAVARSIEKGYHGDEENMNKLASEKEQVSKLMGSLPSVGQFFKVAVNKREKEYVYKVEDLGKSEAEFREAICTRWNWVKDRLTHSEQLSPLSIFNQLLCNLTDGCQKKDRLVARLGVNKAENEGQSALEGIERPGLSWKEMFLVYDLVEWVQYLDFSADFSGLYERIHVLRHVKALSVILPITRVSHLKSDYHYATVLL